MEMILCLEIKEILLNIVVPLIAALIGGFMALLGVKITLHHEERRRLREFKIQNRPFLLHTKKPTHENAIATKVNISNIKKVNFRLITDDSVKEIDLSNYFILNELWLQNTKYSDFCFVGVKINDQEFLFDKDKDLYIPKDTYIYIQTDKYIFYAEDGLKKLELIIADLFDNKYYIDCLLDIKKEKRVFGTNNKIEKSISIVDVSTISKAIEK